MTEDMKKKLEVAHAEELSDHKKYMELSKECCDHHSAGILCDIAHEEMTHAELLAHILDKEA